MNTGKGRFKNRLMVATSMSCSVLLGWTAFSGTIYYKGPGGDLADPANWSAPDWSSADTLVVSTVGADSAAVAIPENGFCLSGDLPANAKLWFTKLPDRDVFFNTAGHRLNTAELDFNCLHVSDSAKMRRLIFTGGFTNVTKMTYTGSFGHAAFSNGVFCVENSFCLHEWFAYLRILKDAELRICKLDGTTMGSTEWASFPEMTVDGGRFRIAARDDPDNNWRFVVWQHGDNNGADTRNVHVTNGGEYMDDTTYPQELFRKSVNVLIDNGGAYIATNSMKSNRNTMWGSKGTFAVSNGTLRLSQLYLGAYTPGSADYQNEAAQAPIGSTLLFHNSKELFAFAPSCALKGSGIVVSPLAKDNRLRFSGDENAYRSDRFPFGGVSNVVEVAGGEFSVSNTLEFIAGNDNLLRLTGGRTWIGALNYFATSANGSVEVSDTASLHLNWDSSLGGVSNRFVVSGGHFDMGAYWLDLVGEGFRVDVTGGASTGAVRFAENDTRMFVGAGATHVAPLEPGWYGHDEALWFTAGKANQVLVISNGTFECGKPFLSGTATAADRQASSGHTGTEAVPFTNCPNCRIEFRGENPAFVITSAQRHGSAGPNWHQFALGGTVDPETGNWTRRPYKLDNPVRLRFCVPKNGYAQAPFRALTEYGGSLGGNAEFEFDMSAFEWPLRRTRIPLVYAASGYAAWGGKDASHLNVNVDGLNETNADRLPTNPQTGRKAKLVLEGDGKTLSLEVTGTSGMAILFR